ncbi:MAG: baseplate J/gp47 family protein [Leptolyngbyaceae cyanobacterium MO_188.B28]|nr:baseplate J/gp47 family protein [Leptolyngbyaceae cyanobacterium MO_188.B28]
MTINRDQLNNPLTRDGVSQRQRQVSTLSPDFVKVDEHDLADALVLAYRLSEKVAYYGKSNKQDGTWRPFFDSSPLVQLALISKTRPQEVKDCYVKELENSLGDRGSETLMKVLGNWKTHLLNKIKGWHEKFSAYPPFRTTIEGLVKTHLRSPLDRMRSIELGLGQLDDSFYQKFTKALGGDLEPEPDLLPDASFLNREPEEIQDDLNQIFQQLFRTYRQIIQQAGIALTQYLQSQHNHPPALALYVAFWYVMQAARDDLNRMTQRHLDFFYRQVLRLPKRSPQPDQAHLVFQLAKGQTEHKLAIGTGFQAGKDDLGKELIYQLDDELVINRAQITSLKGLYLAPEENPTEESQPGILGVYVSPQADSRDGKGDEFPKDQLVKAWHPFGDQSREHANLGLAIASNIFYLQEGERHIIFTLTFDRKLLAIKPEDLPKLFAVDFSGEKEWAPGEILPNLPNSRASQTNIQNKTLTLEVKLKAEQSPIGSYHTDLTGHSLNTDKPVARLMLNDKERVNQYSPYYYFRQLKITALTISANNIKIHNLIVQNDLSVLDAQKPFMPFGPIPKVGSKFYVGSKEIFQKNLNSLKLEVQWEGLSPKWSEDFSGALEQHYRGYYINTEPVNGTTFELKDYFDNLSLTVERLTQNTWSSHGLKQTYTPFNPPVEGELLNLNSVALMGDVIDQLTDLSAQPKGGFLRFKLNQDFLHNEFVKKYTLQTLAAAKDFSDPEKPEYINGAVYESATTSDLYRWSHKSKSSFAGEEPIAINEPYTPVIQSISLCYSAEANQTDCTLFHLYPFDGFVELTGDEPYFLPQFTQEGELFIGLDQLVPSSALSIFFQVAEETANPDLEKTEVHWSYLKDNTWCALDNGIVSDTTNGLIASGIVKLAISADISKTKTTILDSSLHWLKVSVTARSGAICQIISRHTQAAPVILNDPDSHPTHFNTPLAAGTIAKLVTPQAAVKKIEQPYAAFGGQGKEQPAQFYTRISEHLRHKGRAVTIFDYERLVLEHFPDVYQVRCLNHSQVDRRNQQLYQVAPGVVTLVVIPDLSQRNTTNDLEPRFNLRRLKDIEAFLTKLSSEWSTIEVVNPVYEPLQADFKVRFREPYHANFEYYRRQLEQAIRQFLAPWTADPSTGFKFGGSLYRSAVLNFLETLEYVDYVVDFRMHHTSLTGSHINVQEAIASTPRSILTSVSPDTTQINHLISAVPDLDPNQPSARPPSLNPGKLGYTSLKELTLRQDSPTP